MCSAPNTNQQKKVKRDVMGSLIVYNANILTMNPAALQAQALAVQKGRILYVGSNSGVREFVPHVETVIDAHGATLLPGFIDTHVHFTLTGLGMMAVDLSGIDRLENVLVCLSVAAQDLPLTQLIVCLNYQPELNPENRFPSPLEMNRAASGRPVYIMDRTGHQSAVNRAALDLLQLEPDTPGIQLDAVGDFSGVLTDRANSVASSGLWPLFAGQAGPDERRLHTAFNFAARDAIRGGITTLHALDDLEHVRALLAYQEHLPLRIVPYTQTRDVASVRGLGLRQIGGCGQVMVDGDFGPHTAALLEPYLDKPETRGTLYYQDAELQGYVEEVHNAGLQLGLHCVGSAAIEQLLKAYEHALTNRPRPNHRHRIEHFELPAAGQAERARKLGLLLATQPAFNYYWPHNNEEYSRVIGAKRALQVDPVRSLLQAGVHIAFGSDSPVTPLRPLLWVHSAVNHSNLSERISVETALKLASQAGSYLAFEEAEKGTLEPGKLADFVILAENPLAVAPDHLKDIAVLKTAVNGEIVFDEGNP
jgi:predicted amidohydrolase YtcJ